MSIPVLLLSSGSTFLVDFSIFCVIVWLECRLVVCDEDNAVSVGEVGADAGFEMFSRKFQVRDRSG